MVTINMLLKQQSGQQTKFSEDLLDTVFFSLSYLLSFIQFAYH